MKKKLRAIMVLLFARSYYVGVEAGDGSGRVYRVMNKISIPAGDNIIADLSACLNDAEEAENHVDAAKDIINGLDKF
jgi:hypothetical protein